MNTIGDLRFISRAKDSSCCIYYDKIDGGFVEQRANGLFRVMRESQVLSHIHSGVMIENDATSDIVMILGED